MASTTFNGFLDRVRGRFGNIVFKMRDGVTFISRPPALSTAEPTAAQLAARERFRLAAAYTKSALADPVLRPLYEQRARDRQRPVVSVAVADYFNPPVVEAIDATGYHGRIGDLIKVAATDDFEVVGVNVVIRDAALAVLEQGPAALADGRWTYAATVAVAAGDTVTIEAVAKDRPGHPGTKSQPCLVA